MESYAYLASSFNLRIDEVRLAAGKKIMMVSGRSAAGQQQLCHADQGSHVHGFFVETRPQRIERAQPIEKLEVRCTRTRTRQRLTEMMVGVD
jgi:hypothetical protein